MTSGGRGLKNDDVSIFFKIKAVNKTGGQGLTPVEATFYLHFPISKTMVNKSAAF